MDCERACGSPSEPKTPQEHLLTSIRADAGPPHVTTPEAGEAAAACAPASPPLPGLGELLAQVDAWMDTLTTTYPVCACIALQAVHLLAAEIARRVRGGGARQEAKKQPRCRTPRAPASRLHLVPHPTPNPTAARHTQWRTAHLNFAPPPPPLALPQGVPPPLGAEVSCAGGTQGQPQDTEPGGGGMPLGERARVGSA